MRPGRRHDGRRVDGDVEPDQQPSPARPRDARVVGEAGEEPLAEVGDAGEQAVVLDRVEDGQGGGAGDRVATERGAVVAGLQQVAGPAEAEAGTDRDAAAEALGQGDDVGLDTGLQ